MHIRSRNQRVAVIDGDGNIPVSGIAYLLSKLLKIGKESVGRAVAGGQTQLHWGEVLNTAARESGGSASIVRRRGAAITAGQEDESKNGRSRKRKNTSIHIQSTSLQFNMWWLSRADLIPTGKISSRF